MRIMRGFLWIEKSGTRSLNPAVRQQVRMLIASISVGVIAGVFVAYVKLGLGLSGHKALFWMTPVLLARLLGKCKAGTTAGALAAAFTCYSLPGGGHMGGGLIGLPLIGVVGIVFDAVIGFAERHQLSRVSLIPLIGFTALLGNLIMFSKRLLNPPGASHAFLGIYYGFWFYLFSYALFGLLAGTIAAVGAWLYHRSKPSDPA
jgi:hypothetical protein